MTLLSGTPEGSKLAAVVQSLSSRLGDKLAAKFASQLFNEADSAEIQTYETADLAALAADAFESFRTRMPGEPKAVLHACSLKSSGFLVIDIVNDDMPFLLDSVVGALRDLGLVPELVAHPIFEVRRDGEGRILALGPVRAAVNGAPRESFIHLQIRKTGLLPPPGELAGTILKVLDDVRAAVSDFEAMTARLQRAIGDFERNPPPDAPETNAEAIAFLRWLSADNFIFLGVREYDYTGGRDTGELVPIAESGLGLLRSADISVLRQSSAQPRLTPQIRTFFLTSPPVIVAKGNDKSTVHHNAHMDVIGIKLYGEGGKIAGQLRVAGLFTASVYNHSTFNIPLLRKKAGKCLSGLGYPQDSHSGRALLNVLETFPREELFQIPEDQLARIASEILKIDLMPRPRVFIRRDEFERFISALVYVPRERYNTDARVAILKMLVEAFGGRIESFTPFFPSGPMVRTHIVIWRTDAGLKDAAEAALEKEVEKIVRNWSDEFCSLILQHYGSAGYALGGKYLRAFPAGYQETNRPERALEDIQRLEKLGPDRHTDIDIYRDDPADLNSVRATLQQLDEPLTLSKRVPILENIGFDVISERTFQLTPKMDGVARLVYLHDSDLRLSNGGGAELLARRENIENGFLAVWSDAAANDRFNGLILNAGLTGGRPRCFALIAPITGKRARPMARFTCPKSSTSIQALLRTCSLCSTRCSTRQAP